MRNVLNFICLCYYCRFQTLNFTHFHSIEFDIFVICADKSNKEYNMYEIHIHIRILFLHSTYTVLWIATLNVIRSRKQYDEQNGTIPWKMTDFLFRFFSCHEFTANISPSCTTLLRNVNDSQHKHTLSDRDIYFAIISKFTRFQLRVFVELTKNKNTNMNKKKAPQIFHCLLIFREFFAYSYGIVCICPFGM